jgi:hypothetical protein
MNTWRWLAGWAVILVLAAGAYGGDDDLALPAGTELRVQMITELSVKENDSGDFWTSKVVEPIFGKGTEIVPAGSTVDGHITFVKDPTQKKGKGEMRLLADSVSTPDGSKYTFAPSLENPQLPKKDEESASGMAAGLAHKFHKTGKNAVPPPGTELTFVISRDTVAKKVPNRQ